MSKYCQAGKISCEHKDEYNFICTATVPHFAFGGLNFEVCPVKSRQKPITTELTCNCVHLQVHDAPFLIVYPQKECPVHRKYHDPSI